MAEALQLSVGPRFKLAHWSFFSCHLSSEQWIPQKALHYPQRTIKHIRMCFTTNTFSLDRQCSPNTADSWSMLWKCQNGFTVSQPCTYIIILRDFCSLLAMHQHPSTKFHVHTIYTSTTVEPLYKGHSE